jgi:hypothetical protein
MPVIREVSQLAAPLFHEGLSPSLSSSLLAGAVSRHLWDTTFQGAPSEAVVPSPPAGDSWAGHGFLAPHLARVRACVCVCVRDPLPVASLEED